MRRVLLVLIALFVLVGCSGGPSDTTIPEPPGASAYQQSTITEVNDIVNGWKSTVPGTMTANAVKPETIKEQIFNSTAGVGEIAAFYQAQLLPKGWVRSTRMPNVDGNFLITGYESGNYDLVIGAVDQKEYGGSGTVVYILSGNR